MELPSSSGSSGERSLSPWPAPLPLPNPADRRRMAVIGEPIGTAPLGAHGGRRRRRRGF